MKCNQCGKDIPKTNQHSIFYNGIPLIVCGKHYSQYVKHGHFLDESQYSCKDSNEWEITDEGVWIICFNRQEQPSGKFLIDQEDLDRVMTKKWRYWKGRFYTGNQKPISIYQFIMNPPNGKVVDHINGNVADNRKSNLRVIEQSKNLINKAILSNNKSGISGVMWDKERSKWAAEIRMDNIKCSLSRYNNIEDAVYARYYSELKLFKEFRSTRNDDIILGYVMDCNSKEEIEKYVDKRLKLKFNI